VITIAEIETGSQAEQVGLLPGDKIVSINGETIRDRLDYEFFRTEPSLEVSTLRDGEEMQFQIEREYGTNLGIEPEVMKIHICKNNCVFCFVYQNPKGMRKSLYVKDEDYRYSFLDGHFTTLSNMEQADWDRVLEQNLSPLYISVQATEPELRARLLGNDSLEPIMERLKWLQEHNIDFHTQLVVIPEWNDREHLTRSMEDLLTFYPSLQSISVVPIGLTKKRDKLPDLRSFTQEDAEDALSRVNNCINKCKEEWGENLVYAGDEMYVIAKADLPPPEFYGDYSQYENGVGTLTALWDDFQRELVQLPMARDGWEITVLTGKTASCMQRDILEILAEEKNVKYELLICENHTFGEMVTVTGLLCGDDFRQALKRSEGKGPVLIPPNSLNNNNQFLDDLTPKDLEEEFGRKIIAPNSFREYCTEVS
jgi:putative radical SAM enzyme (TIGR03279 family)